MTGIAFIEAARRYIGTPWLHQGDSRSGMDCAGLLVAAARDCGILVPPVLHSPLPDLVLFDDILPRLCERVATPEIGSVLRFTVAGRPQHLGIAADYAAGGLSVVHAYMTVGAVCEHRLDARWIRRLVSCWRVRGL